MSGDVVAQVGMQNALIHYDRQLRALQTADAIAALHAGHKMVSFNFGRSWPHRCPGVWRWFLLCPGKVSRVGFVRRTRLHGVYMRDLCEQGEPQGHVSATH